MKKQNKEIMIGIGVIAICLLFAFRDAQRHWQPDADKLRSMEGAAQREAAAAPAPSEEQRQRQTDAEAELYSYWSTTLRVDTDMDSFWLQGEERTCQTYPDNHGKVVVVSCSGGPANHNIPVTFWGGVDRNKVSDWKCRREGDRFVCRAIN